MPTREKGNEGRSRAGRGCRPPAETRSGGRGADAEFVELCAGAFFFVCARITANHFAELADSGNLLADLKKSKPSLQVRRCKFEALGIIDEDLLVFRGSLPILFLREGDLAEVELRVRGKVRVRIILQVIQEFLPRQVILSSGNVSQAVGIKRVGRGLTARGGRSGRAGCAGRGRSGRSGDFAVDSLERVLDVGELLIKLSEPDLHLFEIVRKGLDLRGHRIQAGAGVGLNVLNGLLQVAHDVVQAANGGRVLVEKGLDRGVFLVDGAGNVLLALEQRGHVTLELDDFTRYRRDWGGGKQQASQRACEKRAAKKQNGLLAQSGSSF